MKALFLAILEQHKGKGNAISLPALAALLGTDTRTVQFIKRELIEDGEIICSSCQKNSSGYYLPSTAEEIEASKKNLKNRAFSLLRAVHKLEGGHGLQEFLGQLRLDMDEAAPHGH